MMENFLEINKCVHLNNLTLLNVSGYKLTFGISVASLEISRISACSIVSVLPSVIVFLVALKTIAFARSSVLIEALLDL